VAGLFYNPNIHPYREFTERLNTLAVFAKVAQLPIEIDPSYDLETFLRGALEEGSDRCLFCYGMRLKRAFREAKEGGFDAITTTLLYSKYQRHDDIAALGEKLAERYAVPFLYRDFRAGWREGQEESKRLGMYRQKYCGCILSERDRFYKPMNRER
jgi:epoxyqueuosine reductase